MYVTSGHGTEVRLTIEALVDLTNALADAGAHPHPMTVAITPLDPVGADRAEPIALLTGSAWPFPVRPHVTRPVAKEAIEDGGGHSPMLGHQLPM